MHKYLFVDTAAGEATTVNAPDFNAAWRKYVDYRRARLPEYPWDKSYASVREDLANDVFVLTEKEVHEL